MKMNRLTRLTGLLLVLVALVALTAGCKAGSTGDQAIFGGTKIIRAGDTVNGDLAVFGGTVTIEEGATINGDVANFGGAIYLDGTVTGDFANIGGTLTRGEGSAVLGESANLGGAEYGDVEEGVAIPAPSEVPGAPPAPESPPMPMEMRGDRPGFANWLFDLVGGIVGTLLKTIAFGVLGLVLTIFLPEHVRRVGHAAEHAPAASAAVGCLAFPALALAIVLAAITVIGIPIAILLPFVATAAAVFGWIGLGFFLGDRLLRAADVRSPRPAAAAAVGAGGLALMSSLIGVIPVVGWFVNPFLWVWAFGAAILTRGGTQAYPLLPRASQPVPPPTDDPLADIEPTPRPGKGSGNLFADLAKDLGIEGEIYGQDDDDERPNRPEKPVPPPDKP